MRLHYPWICQLLVKNQHGETVPTFCHETYRVYKRARLGKSAGSCGQFGPACRLVAVSFDSNSPFSVIEQFRVSMTYTLELPNVGANHGRLSKLKIRLDRDPRSWVYIEVRRQEAHQTDSVLGNRYNFFIFPGKNMGKFAEYPVQQMTDGMPFFMILLQMDTAKSFGEQVRPSTHKRGSV